MLREKAGDILVEPKRRVADSTNWARLEPTSHSAQTLAAFIDALPDNDSCCVGNTAEDIDATCTESVRLEQQHFQAEIAGHKSDQHEYLFDFPLPVHKPELLHGLKIPRYFCQDFFQRAPEGSLYRDSWPSLFIGPPGSACSLHIDANHTHFWMALFGEGMKEWILFPPEDTASLHPHWPPLGAATRDAVFDVAPFDEWSSQHQRFPSIAGAQLNALHS